MEGWAKVKTAAQYASVSEKVFRGWLTEGLKHSRLTSNRILVKFSDIDEYLARFSVTESKVQKMVNKLMEGF